MARLIDADALKEFIDDCGICAICPQKAPRCSYDCDFPDAVTEKWNVAIDAQPTIDAVSVVHGEWIKHKERTETNGKFIDFFPAEYECSNCGLREAHYFINSKPHNYCPNCGAKMKGADDE